MPNVDMQLIKEAIGRRSGGNMGGGTSTPAIGQRTAPTGAVPGGGANVPNAPVDQAQAPVQGGGAMPPRGGGVPPRQAAQGAAQAGQTAQSPMFDDETRVIGKALIGKLLKVL